MVFFIRSFREKKFKQAALTVLFPLLLLLTCLTATYETIKGGGNLAWIFIAFGGAYFGNYSGPRNIYFNRLLSKLTHLCCCGNVDLNAFPAVAEEVTRKVAVANLDVEEAAFTARQAALSPDSCWGHLASCCSGLWKSKPAQDARADSNFVAVSPGAVNS